jgi:hypothetical protein
MLCQACLLLLVLVFNPAAAGAPLQPALVQDH